MQRPEGQLERPGPNFAGHYIIVEIGCGSPCVVMAIVDALTGRIYNPPMSEGLAVPHLGGGPWLPAVEFRLDSSLTIMRPCPNRGPVDDHYFLWKDNQWQLIRRIQHAQPRSDPFCDPGMGAVAGDASVISQNLKAATGSMRVERRAVDGRPGASRRLLVIHLTHKIDQGCCAAGAGLVGWSKAEQILAVGAIETKSSNASCQVG